jgi:hypothetical protein
MLLLQPWEPFAWCVFNQPVLLLCTPLLIAGGPSYVVGTTYFNPNVVGQPIHWSTGQVSHFLAPTRE